MQPFFFNSRDGDSLDHDRAEDLRIRSGCISRVLFCRNDGLA